jgi:hypothetical protein
MFPCDCHAHSNEQDPVVLSQIAEICEHLA